MEALVVAAARMAPLALVAPWAAGLGGVGVIARLLVALGLAAAAAGMAPATGAVAPSLPVLVGEALVGGALGLVSAVPFRAAQAAGGLVDVGRGGGRERGPLGDALLLLALALFAALDGPRLVVAAAIESYVALPAGTLVGAAGAATLAAMVASGARIVALGAALAAPILAALVLAELVGALAARAAGRLAPERGAGADVVRQVVALAVLAASAVAVARAIAGGDAGLRALPVLVGDVARLLGGAGGGGAR
jgi:type III secretion protein T